MARLEDRSEVDGHDRGDPLHFHEKEGLVPPREPKHSLQDVQQHRQRSPIEEIRLINKMSITTT